MPASRAVPLLRVADVGRSLSWYREILGFSADPFPDTPPYRFAILRHGPVELMLRSGSARVDRTRSPYDWDVSLRLQGEDLRELFGRLQAGGVVSRRLERMPYGLAEFEITDPDGYTLCLAQSIEAGWDDLPMPES